MSNRKLTPRETVIFRELVETSDSIREIALRLNRSQRTVKQQATWIYFKVGVENREELKRKYWNDTAPVLETAVALEQFVRSHN